MLPIFIFPFINIRFITEDSAIKKLVQLTQARIGTSISEVDSGY